MAVMHESAPAATSAILRIAAENCHAGRHGRVCGRLSQDAVVAGRKGIVGTTQLNEPAPGGLWCGFLEAPFGPPLPSILATSGSSRFCELGRASGEALE